MLGGAVKLVFKGAVKGSHRVKAALQGTVGDAVLFFVHKLYGVFEPNNSKILIYADVKTGLEISREITLTVAKGVRKRF